MPQKMIQSIYHFHSKEGINMNKIYKVIWSKAKHTYVVASEIAKGHTKGETTGKGLKRLAAALLVAAALMGPNFAWAADIVTVTDTSTTQQTMYTKDGADNTFATKGSLTTEATERANVDSTLQTNIDNEVTNRKAADSTLQTNIDNEATNRKAADTTLQSNIDTEATDRKNADKTIQQAVDAKANAADVYSKDVADDTFATKKSLAQETTDRETADMNLQKAVDAKANAADVYSKADADTTFATKTEVNTADTNLQKSIDEEARKRKYSVTNLENADKQLQTNIDNEAAAREAEDTRLNSEIVKTNTSLNEAASNLSKLNDTVAKGFEDLSTEDKTLQTNINNEAAAREAADTALEEKVNKNTSDISGMQSDSKVSEDGSYVKTTNTVGENLTALDTGLQAEVTAREDEDNKLQSAIDEEARKRKYSVTNLEKADKQLQTNIDNEAAARKAADTKLVEAVNSGLSLSNDNVLQKNTTSVGEDGTVTTFKEAATTLVMNKGGDNQITLSDKGIKVGLNSGVMDKDGFYAGGDTADAAKAALKADGSIKGADGKFTVDADGKVTAASVKIGNVEISSTGAVSGVTDMTASGTITGNKLTDGVASLQNGNLTTTGNINAHAIVATGDISGKAITGTSLNTQGGDINGGAITGTTITGTTGTFGSLTTTGNASVGGTLSSNGLTNTGNATTDTLKVNHNATVGGDLAVTGDITGKSLNVGTGAISGGQITGTGLNVGGGTIKTTGAVATGTLETTGNATIGGDLTVDKDLTVNGTFDAKTLSSTVDANNYTTITGGKTQSMNKKEDAETGEAKASASTFDENGSNAWAKDDDSIGKSSMTADKISQSLSDKGDNPKNEASRVLSQNTNNKYEITDSVVEGNQSNVENRTADTTDSQISFKDDSGKVLNKSYITQNLKKVLMGVEEGDNKTTIEQDANNIINTSKNGTIKNDAKDLVNKATGDMTNTVGGKLLNDVTGDMENKVGGNLSTTVGGSQTTTVTGDSSLTAENINNTAKNKITNKALDVETEAKSSIVNKVSNDAGSNTSTQLSYETKEEMSANGKNASYLRGAAEEKSQLTDGAKKTTIDTVAGQTNTNITDGTNTSNDLQKADQIASSVTDGTNTTVVNQDAKSLASSITDGTKANNTNNTVDKSEQLIKASDTQYSATSKTATKMEDALVSGGSVIDVIKNLDDAANPFIGSAVTDGTNSTGVTQTAKDITNTAKNGTIANEAKDIINNATENMTTTVGGEMKTTVTGKVTEDYKSDLDTTVGGNQTTTVTGDSSLKAENITNEAKNKITNKAIDVETDAASSIVSKVSNDAGSNTSTQLSYQTTEEMKADGKTASYLRGAAEEKSQLIDGDKKTTIDTIAGQTNTNITEGTNVSNSLQKADQLASSVTDGTNTTVVNQNAGSLASSITDGTNQNNTNNTVNKSEQLIKADDTHFYAETRTAEKAEEALKSGNTVIDIVKDTKTATVSSAVTDGTTITGISQNAKDISLSAAGGTITNDAKTLLNKASESITDKVGENVERTMTTKKISESVKDGTKSNSFSKTAEKDINIITDGTTTSTLSQLANSVNTSLKNGTQSLNNTKTVTEDVTKVTDKNTGAFSSSSQKADAMTNTVKNGSKSNTVTETASTSEQKLVSGNIIDILKDAENGYVNTTVSNSDGSSSTGVKQTYTDITNTAKQGTITNEAKNLVNKAEEKLSNSAAEIENTATTSIKDTVGKSTVTTTTDGTTFENTDHNVAIGDGSIKKTTISGNTLETGKATMDYAEVMKDLRVGGTTTTEDLHVTNNATIDGTLDVTGAANFQNKVTVAKDLSVGGDVTADSYKVGDKTYIDKDGINANNQVIRNVGQGNISEGSTDAVSGGQLYETNTRVSGLETRMGTVETRVDKLDGKIDKVGANAAAMANLHPLEFDEDSKWNVAAAVGSSGSETASAVGVFYRPNENVMVNASAAMGTGENMFGGGVSLRLGHGGNKAKEAQMKAAAAENKELRAKVDDLTARMDALLSVLNPNMSKDFPDVPENHWAYEAVSRLAGNGIVEGYEDGKYHGERQMTRYEMAEIIYNALSKGAKAEKKLVEEFRPELQAMAAQKKA